MTVIATGFESREKRSPPGNANSAHNRHNHNNAAAERQVVHLDDDVKKSQPSLFTITSDQEYAPVEEKAAGAIEFEFENIRETVEKIRRTRNSGSDPYVRPYEDELTPEKRRRRIEEAQRRKEEARNRPLNVVKLNSPQTIIELENQPAYLRKNVNLDNIPDADQPGMSGWTISLEEEAEIRMGGNSFLHDNVD